MDYRKISVCIPTWERLELLFESFSIVLSDIRISEVVIVDDHSSQEVYWKIYEVITTCNAIHNNKIKLFRNHVNLDCYLNKREAISKATNQWCIILDSDNVIDKSYLDRLYKIPEWSDNTVYCPTFAKPHFDYRAFSGLTIDRENINQYVNEAMFLTALNTFNCFINKNNYLESFDSSIDPIVNDSIYFMYCWLNSGRKIHFLDGLEYLHTVHSGSHYQKNVSRTPTNLTREIENKLRQLK